MKWWWIALTLLCAIVAGLYWLGWTRSGNWRVISGWSMLPEQETAWESQSAAAYADLQNRPDLAWFGHASVEVEWGGVSLLTDPVNSSRVKIAPRCFDDLALPSGTKTDGILLTHAHMDHMDNSTLARLPSTRVYLPAGSERFLSTSVRARHTIVPVMIGESQQVGALEVIPVPARHGGWRYPWQRGLFACGYIIRHVGESLYVAGDTALGDHFARIGRDYAPRYAIFPVGAYSPEWFLRSRHLNPEEAAEAAAALGSEFVIPYHFGTYRLSLEPIDAPLRRWSTVALAKGQKWLLPVE